MCISVWTNFVLMRQWQQELSITHKWTKNFIFHSSKCNRIVHENYHSTENITKYNNFILNYTNLCLYTNVSVFLFLFIISRTSQLHNQQLACYHAHLCIYRQYKLFIIVKRCFPTMHHYSKYYTICEFIWSHKVENWREKNPVDILH